MERGRPTTEAEADRTATSAASESQGQAEPSGANRHTRGAFVVHRWGTPSVDCGPSHSAPSVARNAPFGGPNCRRWGKRKVLAESRRDEVNPSVIATSETRERVDVVVPPRPRSPNSPRSTSIARGQSGRSARVPGSEHRASFDPSRVGIAQTPRGLHRRGMGHSKSRAGMRSGPRRRPRRARKDTDARWTMKFSEARLAADGSPQIDVAVPRLGYKSHILVAWRHGIIHRHEVTHAAAHDGAQPRKGLIDPNNIASDVPIPLTARRRMNATWPMLARSAGSTAGSRAAGPRRGIKREPTGESRLCQPGWSTASATRRALRVSWCAPSAAPAPRPASRWPTWPTT